VGCLVWGLGFGLEVYGFECKVVGFRVVGLVTLGFKSTVGGVSHCSLHCRLAKFRGLMINAEYSPVIGWKNPTFVWSQSKSPGYRI
jgi:hypothetical protein